MPSTVVLKAIDESVPSRADHKFLGQPAVSPTLEDVGDGGSARAEVVTREYDLATVPERVTGDVKNTKNKRYASSRTCV